ncbi:MAG: DUF4230 domain-containing protein [Bacteroidota bacterium]
MKNILLLLVIIAAFALGGFLSWQFNKPAEKTIINESTVLLEQVRKVFKLVTIEGDVVETYRGGDIKNLVFYLPFPMTYPAQKEAIIKVQGKVLVGFDMKQMKVEAFPESKQIKLSNLPEPEILSIDHDLSYFNIEESWFNTFDADDYTRLNKEAKERLRNSAKNDALFEQAKVQGNQLIDVIRFMVESTGWTLIYDDPELIRMQDSLLMDS